MSAESVLQSFPIRCTKCGGPVDADRGLYCLRCSSAQPDTPGERTIALTIYLRTERRVSDLMAAATKFAVSEFPDEFVTVSTEVESRAVATALKGKK